MSRSFIVIHGMLRMQNSQFTKCVAVSMLVPSKTPISENYLRFELMKGIVDLKQAFTGMEMWIRAVKLFEKCVIA